MATDDREWDQHHRSVRHRLGWAPLLANGGLIVAIVSGAAQTSNPQAGLHYFAAPLVFYGVGAAFGLVGEQLALRGDEEWKRGTAWWEDPEGPFRRLQRDIDRVAELQAQPKTPENLRAIRALASEMKPLIEVTGRVGPTTISQVTKSGRLKRWASGIRWSSLVACTLGFAAMVASAFGV